MTDAFATEAAFAALFDERVDGIDVWPIVKTALEMAAITTQEDERFRAARSAYRNQIALGLTAPGAHRLGPLDREELRGGLLCLSNASASRSLGGRSLNTVLAPLIVGAKSLGVVPIVAYADTRALNAPDLLARAATVQHWIEEAGEIARAKTPTPTQPHRGDSPAKLHAKLAAAADAAAAAYAAPLVSHLTLVRRLHVVRALKAKFVHDWRARGAPRAVALVHYYGPAGWAACAAAREVGTPTFDVQHGVQSPSHHAYGWPEAPGRDWSVRPDGFLCWSAADAANARQLGSQRGAFAMGAPLLHLHVRRGGWLGPTIKMTAEADALAWSARAEAARARGRRVVTVLTQVAETDAWVAELAKRLGDQADIWIRRHPILRSESWPTCTGLANVALADDAPLEALLEYADVAVTGYSTTALEAAAFGAPVVTHSPFADVFLPDVGLRATTASAEDVGRACVEAFSSARTAPMRADLADPEAIADFVLNVR